MKYVGYYWTVFAPLMKKSIRKRFAASLGNEKAVLCICHMDKEYSQGFKHIRYDRNSAVSEGGRACAYRLCFDPEKD